MRRFALALLPALLACPGEKKPPPPPVDSGVPPVSAVELCDRLSVAQCDLLDRCYAAFARLTRDDCQTLENAKCLAEFGTLKPSFDAEKAEVDGDKLTQCESRMEKSACPPTFPPGYSSIAAHPFSDCTLETGLIRGKVASGDTCDRAIECAPGSVCVKPNGVCKGTCSSYPQEGEGCAFGCAPGLFCDDHGTPLDANDDTCAVPKGANEPCSSSVQCAAELICTNGQCRPRGTAGEGCIFDPDRLSTCEPGLACDVTPFVNGATGKCVVPQPANSPCSFHWSCAVGLVCADLSWSNFPAAAPTPGECRAPAHQDDPCSPTVYQSYVGDQCGPELTCSPLSFSCAAAPKQSDSCPPSAQNCVGLDVYCKPNGSGDVGICTGPVGDGERCAFSIDASHTVTIPCTSGFCDADSTLVCRPAYKDVGALCAQDGECRSNRCAVQQDQSLRCADACQ